MEHFGAVAGVRRGVVVEGCRWTNEELGGYGVGVANVGIEELGEVFYGGGASEGVCCEKWAAAVGYQ